MEAERSPRASEPGLMRIVYVSTAARPLDEADLDAIVRASQRRNGQSGLTGLLLYGAGRFYGVLEGPRRRVLARMERVAVDPRHRNMVVLSEERISEPRFANWSFGTMPDDGRSDALDLFILGLAGRL